MSATDRWHPRRTSGADGSASGVGKPGRGATRSRPPTIGDIARVAGVSIATVSLVVNGKAQGRVGSATQSRVQAVVTELGYRTNNVARGLATGRRHTIGLIAPDIRNPYFSDVAVGVSHAIGSDYELLLIVPEHGYSLSKRLVDHLASLRLDGVVVETPWEEALLGSVDAITVMDSTGTDEVVGVDFALGEGASQLARHLVELGHRRVAYMDVADLTDLSTFKTRRESLFGGLPDLAVEDSCLTASALSISSSASAFTAAWPTWDAAGVTALVCATDIQAYGALKAARDLGVSVPGRLSVAAFDDLAFSEIVEPPLTTVALPAYDLGYRAAQLLRDLLDGNAVQAVVLPATLIVRESTARRYEASGPRPPVGTEL